MVLPAEGQHFVRGTFEPLSFARLADIPLIAFEAESWSRHVLTAACPSLPTYLMDRFS
jgi:hypothetical protein